MAITKTDQQLLDEAMAARHALVTGQQAIEVDFGTYRTKFNPSNRDALDSYIAELQARIAGEARRGAIGVIF